MPIAVIHSAEAVTTHSGCQARTSNRRGGRPGSHLRSIVTTETLAKPLICRGIPPVGYDLIRRLRQWVNKAVNRTGKMLRGARSHRAVTATSSAWAESCADHVAGAQRQCGRRIADRIDFDPRGVRRQRKLARRPRGSAVGGCVSRRTSSVSSRGAAAPRATAWRSGARADAESRSVHRSPRNSHTHRCRCV